MSMSSDMFELGGEKGKTSGDRVFQQKVGLVFWAHFRGVDGFKSKSGTILPTRRYFQVKL